MKHVMALEHVLPFGEGHRARLTLDGQVSDYVIVGDAFFTISKDQIHKHEVKALGYMSDGTPFMDITTAWGTGTIRAGEKGVEIS